eukprot:scaffold4240_cov73-Phaeocystis_antarctica.AAC.2
MASALPPAGVSEPARARGSITPAGPPASIASWRTKSARRVADGVASADCSSFSEAGLLSEQAHVADSLRVLDRRRTSWIGCRRAW